MLTEKEVKEKLKELEGDERMSYKPANIEINAPLALIQVSIEAKIQALKWVMEKQKHLVCS